MKAMIAQMVLDYETSRLLWRQLYESANNDYAKVAARTKRAFTMRLVTLPLAESQPSRAAAFT